jgi:hypothetical protein
VAAHLFISGAACVWCANADEPARVTPELVADRRAPPFCVNAPEDVQRRDMDDARQSGNDATGY